MRVSGSGEQSQPENLYRYTKVENRVLRRFVWGEAMPCSGQPQGYALTPGTKIAVPETEQVERGNGGRQERFTDCSGGRIRPLRSDC